MTNTASRLLILDDDPLIGETIQAMVQKGGYETRYTDDPAEFFSLLESWQPEFIAIDLIMPQMDGVEVITGLAARQASTKIIISSGADYRVLDAAKRSASEHGLTIIGILSKPYTRQTLLDMLDDNRMPAVSSPNHAKPEALPEPSREDIEQALVNDEFSIVMQPKIHCRDYTLAGFEALSRWNHPQYGFVRPDIFIALAEKYGLIDTLTEQVVSKALLWLKAMPESIDEPAGLEGLSTRLRSIGVSINISARSLQNIGLFDRIASSCLQHGIDPGRIILELTETSAMEDPLTSLDILTRLRVKGFKLSIDDFGTGYSSMKQLVRLPFSEIKIDRSFVMSAKTSQESRSITHAIIELGASLNLTTIAEGIEDAETLEFLREEGCDQAQGFHIAKPLPLAAVNDWILTHAWQCEARRLAELKDLDILDTPQEERFERHARLARRLFDVPFAVISLVAKNRQWFKSGQDLPMRETSRNVSFCTHTIAEDGFMQVPDTFESTQFRDYPMVTDAPFIRFYAGVPLRGPKGQIVGVFCLLDSKPRQLSDSQIERLEAIAELVARELAEGQRGFIDSLTGVLNSSGYDSTARQAVQLARRLNLPTLSLTISLDNLTRINEDFGFDQGNNALAATAKILQEVLRRSDVIGRYSSASFRALLIDNSENQVEEVIRRLRERIQQFNGRSDIYTLQCDIRPLNSGSAANSDRTAEVRHIDGRQAAVVNAS